MRRLGMGVSSACLLVTSACYATVGVSAGSAVSGNVDKEVVLAGEVAVGFAFDFDRFFLAGGLGVDVQSAPSRSAEGGNAVQTLRYNLRGDYTLKSTEIWDGASTVFLRGTAMGWLGGCGANVSGMEVPCTGTNFSSFLGITGAMGTPGKANLSLSAGPMFWKMGTASTGEVTGVGGKVFLTLHAASTRPGAGIFRDVSRNMKRNLEHNIEMQRYKDRKANWNRCKRRGGLNCGPRPEPPSRYD